MRTVFVRAAFTLVELMVTVVIIAILAALLLPSLIHAKQAAQGIQCLSNLRQLGIAWKLYVNDNGGNFPGNASEGEPQYDAQDWVTGVESFSIQNDPDNTNTGNLANALLGPYVNGDWKIYKCPADTLPCIEGFTLLPRVRSVSMNCFISPLAGTPGLAADGVSMAYRRESDLGTPAPSELWLMVDENEQSINDGLFVYYEPLYEFCDVPANYHNNACGFSFTDGHAEIHRWIAAYLWPQASNQPGLPRPTLSAPKYGPDISWMERHSSALTVQ